MVLGMTASAKVIRHLMIQPPLPSRRLLAIDYSASLKICLKYKLAMSTVANAMCNMQYDTNT